MARVLKFRIQEVEGLHCTIYVAKTKALISFAVTMKLICVFVFAYTKSRFSHDEAHINVTCFGIGFSTNKCQNILFVENFNLYQSDIRNNPNQTSSKCYPIMMDSGLCHAKYLL